MRKIVLAAGLILLVLSAVFVILPEVVGKVAYPTLVPRTREIQYMVGLGETRWNVTWYAIEGSGEWKFIGEEVLPARFDRQWSRYSELYKGYTDNVGFVAHAVIYMNRTGSVAFTLGSDDGSILYVDSDVAIDLYSPHRFMQESVTVNQLLNGYHDLTIRYFERSGEASVHFDCDQDITGWEEKTGGYRDEVYYEFQTYYGKQTNYYGIAGMVALIGLVLVVNGATAKNREMTESVESQKKRAKNSLAYIESL